MDGPRRRAKALLHRLPQQTLSVAAQRRTEFRERDLAVAVRIELFEEILIQFAAEPFKNLKQTFFSPKNFHLVGVQTTVLIAEVVRGFCDYLKAHEAETRREHLSVASMVERNAGYIA
eukprot:SAG11_NODE_11847_length_735_cov_1.122642_1_plen_118_part_00